MWNFKGYLWNSTENILPLRWKMQFLCNIEILRALRFKSSYAFLKRPPGLIRQVALYSSNPPDGVKYIDWLSIIWWIAISEVSCDRAVLYCQRVVFFFLAATKQLYEWYFPSVCPSVCPSHLFDYVPIVVSSQNFQELLPVTKVMSMQKVKVRAQRSRSQRSQPNLTVSGL